MISLEVIDAVLIEMSGILLRTDPFGDRFHAQITGKVGRSVDEELVFRRLTEMLDIHAVNFHGMHPHLV